MCCIYETEAEHRAVVGPFMRQGLEWGEKVIYIVDAHTAETVLGYLRDQGVDVDAYLAGGQLVLSSHETTYLRDGVFDPDAMIVFLRQTMQQALADGYSALRVTGEMSWALRGLPGSERLVEYEARLNSFFPGSRCTAICQYDRRKFDPAILLDVIHTHPVVIIGTQKYDNFYFVPPDVFLSNRPAARLQQWIQALQDRKAEQDAQRINESFLRQTQEITRVGGWEYRAATKKIIWTDQVYQIYEVDRNYNPSDVSQAISFYAPQDQAAINRAFQRAVEFGEPYELDLELISTSGRHKWVRTSGQAERRRGKVVRVFGMIMDITKSKQAQDALRASEERFRVAQELSLDAFTLLTAVRDKQNRIVDFERVYANAAAGQILSQSPEKLVGEHILQSVDRYPGNQLLYERYVGIVESGQGNEMVLNFNLYGESRWYRSTAIKLGDGVAASFTDITPLKQAEQVLRDAFEYNRSLIEASLDPMVTIGTDGKITDLNTATEWVTGYSRSDMIGTDFSSYFTDPDQARAGFQQVFRDGVVRDYALEIRHRDGPVTSVLYNAAVYRDLSGKVIGIFAAARDITARKQIEAAEREQRTLAEALRDTAAALNSTLDFEDVLDRILDNVGRIIPPATDAVFLLLLDGTGGDARIVRYRSAHDLGDPAGLANLRLPVWRTPSLLDVRKKGSAVIIPDTKAYAGWNISPLTAWIRSNLSVPITSRGEITGFLNLGSATPNVFTQQDADHLAIFANQAAIAIENARLYKEVQDRAITDALTGILNRRGLFQVGEREVERAVRFQHPLAAVMIDIDYFKQVNDTHGHAAGDRVLAALARCCRALVRNVDVFARYGGEEFVILLPETETGSAVQMAERLRQVVEELAVPAETLDAPGGVIRVTVSLGVVMLAPGMQDLAALIARADLALYTAKQSGRNCVILGEKAVE